jgi:hypothetical protein
VFEKLQAVMTERYPVEVQLLLDGGKLVEDWANVARHCLIQAMAAEVIADLLGLDAQIKRRLASVALVHDWRKRLDLRPHDFSEAEIRGVAELEGEVKPDEDLMNATTAGFLVRVLNGEATFLELIQFYLDDITKNDTIVPFEERIADSAARTPVPDADVSSKLPRPFWDVERDVGHQVERMLFAILKARQIEIENPPEIPGLILAEISKRIIALA